MNGPIHELRGAARVYGKYALNIYEGCSHRCFYCFVPDVLHRSREEFSQVKPLDILDDLGRQLREEDFSGKTVHLCLTCDPYPSWTSSVQTREVIALLKGAGAHVQVLTKGSGVRDFDLLDEGDWYGISLTGAVRDQEPGAKYEWDRLRDVFKAREQGIKTWAAFEPVIEAQTVLHWLELFGSSFDRVLIGKLNYYSSDIDWAVFARRAEELCRRQGVAYEFTESLMREIKAKEAPGEKCPDYMAEGGDLSCSK